MRYFKQKNVTLIILILIFSRCNFIGEDKEKSIEQVVKQVAEKNHCALTASYTVSNKEARIILDLRAKTDNDYLPGKILVETYQGLKGKSIMCDRYSIRSSNKGLLLEQTDKEIKVVIQRMESYNNTLNLLKRKQNDIFYNLFSDQIKQNVTKDTLIKCVSSVGFDVSEFDGFGSLQNSSGSFVEIRFINTKGRLSFVYSTDLSDGKIYGMHIR